MTEHYDEEMQTIIDEMPTKKHSEICKEVLFYLWIENKLFTDEQDKEIELMIQQRLREEWKK